MPLAEGGRCGTGGESSGVVLVMGKLPMASLVLDSDHHCDAAVNGDVCILPQ